ncbi:MAG: EamA family transporter [Chloroflexi bacterium]|nr:EamA family transporter [Chloroflexota bacterium]
MLPQPIETWVALVYVVAIGSAAVFLLHVYIVQKWNASRDSYVVVVIPRVTITLSASLDQELLTGGLLLGGVLVLGGVYIGALRNKGTSHPSNEDPREGFDHQ